MPGPHESAERLRADCEQCAGLCCVAPAFAASADFAIDKPAGTPCTHLQGDFRCDIHHRLRAEGFPGCTAFDCFGAGQQVTQVTFAGGTWRSDPAIAEAMFRAFSVMRDLHELLWYLAEALALRPAQPVSAELGRLHEEVEALTALGPAALAELDVAGWRARVGPVLDNASTFVRGETPRDRDLVRRDLLGRDMRGRDLRRGRLVGARLIGADLRSADLRSADVRGTDLRGADLRGADLTGCLFLIQAQVESARGDAGTRLPESVTRPAHWAGRPAGTVGSAGKAGGPQTRE